ncbi:MAG TPA: 3-deoxy-8-phosphooctulonate synthase, partial [Phycisphaerales bacterium]|nr:3-deoxy-8-phosphooctulonate synthase [Phycisphaerales bacterium]
AGVQAIFLECHPDPPKSKSDAGTIQPLAEIPALLKRLKAIRTALTA